MKGKLEYLAPGLFFLSLLMIAFAYGIAVGRYEWFPFSVIQQAKLGFTEVAERTGAILPFQYREVDYEQTDPIFNPGGAYPGLTLVTMMLSDRRLGARLIDLDGRVIHSWDIDWFEMWPNADHLPAELEPKSRPGTHVHGAVIMDNGDLVFNFGTRGLVRIDAAGEVVWRLPHLTHHSVCLDDDGNLWVCSMYIGRIHNPRYRDYVVLKVNGDGEILDEISIADVLQRNKLGYLLDVQNRSMEEVADSIHLNDVERFPATMQPGFFDHDDLVISLRNVNAVLVFNKDTLKVKLASIGQFVYQHDPDFVDGNTISVYDNNRVKKKDPGAMSKIVKITASSSGPTEPVVVYTGTESQPFFSDIGGMHQWLPNGNLLVTDFCGGRGFEVNPEGKIVWQFINYIGPNLVGIVTEVTRVPDSYGALYNKVEK